MNTRGQYGTQPSQPLSAENLMALTLSLSPRAVYYAPHPSDEINDVKIGTGGKTILLVALGAIVTIGVVGTKLGVKWIA